MRRVVLAAYQGKYAGASETGVALRSVRGCMSPRLASPRNARNPSTSNAANRSQRVRTVRLASPHGVHRRGNIRAAPYHPGGAQNRPLPGLRPAPVPSHLPPQLRKRSEARQDENVRVVGIEEDAPQETGRAFIDLLEPICNDGLRVDGKSLDLTFGKRRRVEDFIFQFLVEAL